MAMEQVMNTKRWSYYFPSLNELQKSKPVDLRCSFSKDYISDKLDLSKITQLQFHEDNMLEFQSLLGCGLYIYEGNGSPFAVSKPEVKKANGDEEFEDDDDDYDIPDDLFGDDNEESGKSKEWSTHRGFFGSNEGMLQYEFKHQ